MSANRKQGAGVSSRGGWALGCAALVLAAALGGVALFRIRLNMDVGWMLYLAERVGAGERLYVDRIEVNLPWIVYLSRIPVILASWIGVSSATAFRLMLFLGVVAATLFTAARLNPRARPRPAELLITAAALLLVLLWVAGSDMGEREHLVVLALVPYLVLRWRKEPPGRTTALIVGAAMGVAVALKPHFLLLWLALELTRRFEGYDWRRPEVIAAATVLVGSWVLLPVLHPAYFTQLRDYGHLYAGFRRLPVAAMLRVESLTVMVVLVAWVAGRRDPGLARPVRELLVLVGASLCMAIVQGKGFMYHFYPSHALAALLLLLLLTSWEPAGPARWYVRLTLLLIGASLALYTAGAASRHRWSEIRGKEEYQPAVDLVRESGVDEGSLLVLSPHMLDAFPLVNLTGLEWASRYNSLWPILSLYSDVEPVDGIIPFRTVSRMSPDELLFFRSVSADLLRYEPDLLLVAFDRDAMLGGRFDYRGYLSQDPAVARLLGRYEPVARGARLELYVRRDAADPASRASGARRGGVRGPGDRGGVLVHGVPLARQPQGS